MLLTTDSARVRQEGDRSLVSRVRAQRALSRQRNSIHFLRPRYLRRRVRRRMLPTRARPSRQAGRRGIITRAELSVAISREKRILHDCETDVTAITSRERKCGFSYRKAFVLTRLSSLQPLFLRFAAIVIFTMFILTRVTQ